MPSYIVANRHLPPLPSDDQVLAAIAAMEDSPVYRNHGGALASFLAARLGVEGARRSGRGAVKGSWSGYMDGSLRLVPRLRSLVKQGLVYQWYDSSSRRTRAVYVLTPEGRRRVATPPPTAPQ